MPQNRWPSTGPIPVKLSLVVLGLIYSPAQAHDAVNAGNVQMTWHTDTNERLQVNADTTLSMWLKVEGKPLTLSQCRCTLLLYAGEVNPRVRPTVLKLQPGQDGEWNALVTVTQAGPYSLLLDGKPLNLSDFAPFRMPLKLTAAEDVYNIPKGK